MTQHGTHWLLKQQLEQLDLSTEGHGLNPKTWPALLQQINEVYEQADRERLLFSTLLTRAPHADEGAVASVLREAIAQMRQTHPTISTTSKSEEQHKWATLAGLDHELFTSLTDILGFASVIADGADVELQEYGRLIDQSGTRLLCNLRAMLDLAQQQGGLLKSHAGPVEVATCVREAWRRLAAQRGNLTFRFEGPQHPVWAKADAAGLQRVFHHLICMAIKLLNAGTLHVRVAYVGDDVVVRVQGTGMDRQITYAVLEQAFAGQTESRPLPYGASFGMMVTKQMVAWLGATMDLVPAGRDGFGFKLTLPGWVQTAEEPTAIITQSGATPVAKEEAPTRPAKLPVLVVDDSSETQLLLKQLLRAKYDVDVVSNSEAALAQATHRQYGAVLLDIKLNEERSGVDVMHLLRAMPAYQKTRMVALTAFALPGDRERFLDAGFDEYVGKPFSRQVLLDALMPAHLN